MKENKLKQSVAKGIASFLDLTLKMDANTTSCYIAYQPKAPNALQKYKKRR